MKYTPLQGRYFSFTGNAFLTTCFDLPFSLSWNLQRGDPQSRSWSVSFTPWRWGLRGDGHPAVWPPWEKQDGSGRVRHFHPHASADTGSGVLGSLALSVLMSGAAVGVRGGCLPRAGALALLSSAACPSRLVRWFVGCAHGPQFCLDIFLEPVML